MECSVLGLFKLVLGISPKLTPDVANVSLRASKVSTKEGIELRPYDRGSIFMVALVLSPSGANGATEKCGNKKVIVHPCGN